MGAALSGGLGRFAADLPAVDSFVELGEGDTPVLALPALAAELGLRRLSAKLESLNPTGSYKDRVAAMSLSLARQRGCRGWIATSSGNAGMSFAAYGARAGLPGFLCLVSTAPAEKRAALAPYRIGMVAVDGVGRGGTGGAGTALMAAVRDAAQRHTLFLGITANAFNPDGMRGIDTIGYELAEQAADATHVYLPVGGGGLLASVARGLAYRRHPARVVACQPAGCAPVVRFLDGELAAPLVDRCDTGISALQLPDPPDATLAIDAVRGSDGWGTAAGDGEILTAQRRLAAAEGLFVEPAAATGLAALARDVARGQVGAADHPVLVLTGAGWKDLGRFAAQPPAVPVENVTDHIDRWMEAVR